MLEHILFPEYPHYLPNLHFVCAIMVVTIVNYYVVVNDFPDKVKYGVTFFCWFLMFLIPIPFFHADRNFGAVPLSPNDARAYVPFILMLLISALLKYYSIMLEIIKKKKEIPTYGFTLAYIFILPLYQYEPKNYKNLRPDSDLGKHLLKGAALIGQYLLCWLVVLIAFNFLPWKVPHDILKWMFTGYWWIPILIGSAITTICMFMMISILASLIANFFNIFAKTNFKYYSDKPFLSTSIGEFWKNWNLWTNDWFYTYMYSPLRRKHKLKHYQATFLVFVFSGFLHAYCIALINIQFAAIAFLVFVVSGILVLLEKPVLQKVPVFSTFPKPVKFALTYCYLIVFMGLFGICFS